MPVAARAVRAQNLKGTECDMSSGSITADSSPTVIQITVSGEE